jgi:outer membrane protein OmpA-like peptidoglycan-associated protein
MAEEYVVYGELDGYFYTDQGKAMDKLFETKHDANPDKFNVNLYAGDITNIELKGQYLPHEYENYESIVLSGVKGLTLKSFPKSNQDEQLDFSSLVLINPEYVRHWFTDRDLLKTNSKDKSASRKMYVHVRSKIIGKTVKPMGVKKVTPISPNDPGANGSGGNGANNGGCNPLGGGSTGNILAKGAGCLSSARGCLTNIWRWLLWLLLFLLLLWLVRKCNDDEGRQRTCDEADKMKQKEMQRKRELDSLKRVYDTNLANELANISKVYFYENSNEVSAASVGAFNQVLDFMKKYPNVALAIHGFENPSPKEKMGTDLSRAESLSTFLKENGIDAARLHLKAEGDKRPIVNVMRQTDVKGRNFNRNMRVEIFIFKSKNGK